ncbi:hypothetical protein [Flavobacterium sp. 3HN19-14]|uniref:hypothetical protein n=1 Tax=Flavobacterium sp. 3HN19-14 TaxID=3448133 RepID=UPI003EE38847
MTINYKSAKICTHPRHLRPIPTRLSGTPSKGGEIQNSKSIQKPKNPLLLSGDFLLKIKKLTQITPN